MSTLRAPELRHEEVYRSIESQILDGSLRPGDRIPSERDLSGRFGVSRVTVRRALAELVSKGHLVSHQGRGTFVALPQVGEEPNVLMSFTELGSSRGLTAGAIVLSKRVEPATLTDSEDFRVAPGSDLLVLKRLRLLDGVPVSIDMSRIPLGRAPGLDGVDFTTTSLYSAMEARGARPHRADYSVCAVAAGEAEAELLGVDNGAPLLLTLTTAHDVAGRVVEKGRMAYRGDRYQFHATLLRGHRPAHDADGATTPGARG